MAKGDRWKVKCKDEVRVKGKGKNKGKGKVLLRRVCFLRTACAAVISLWFDCVHQVCAERCDQSPLFVSGSLQ